MKIKITIPLPQAIIDLFDEDDILEAYCDGENIVISNLDEDDVDSFVCDSDCDNCQFNNEDEYDDCPIGENDCEDCEYFCPYCGECIYDEEN